MGKAVQTRAIRCYLCGYGLTVSARAMSTTCPGCNKAIKIEDMVVKTYVPVVDLQTCGRIKVTKRGRIAARRIQCGDGITCDGTIEAAIETDGDVSFGPKSSWKGKTLQSQSITIAAGAMLLGVVKVPWHRPEPAKTEKTVSTRKTVAKKVTAKKITAKKKTTREKARATLTTKTTADTRSRK